MNSITLNDGRAKTTLLATLTLGVGLAIEVFYLLNDIPLWNPPSSRSFTPSTPPIAELMTRQNDVKTQAPDELVWNEAREGQTLYRRQSVLTLEGSKAEIAFLDGTGLTVDEKSLVQLEKTPSDESLGYQRLVIKLLRGKIHKSSPRKTSDLSRKLGARTPEIEIQTGDTHVMLTPSSELTITALPEDPTRGARIEVQSGEVSVVSPHGQMVSKQGEEVTTFKDSESKPEVKTLSFTLLSPKGGTDIQALNSKQRIRFRWNAAREAATGTTQEVEISQDPQFRSVTVRSKIPAAEPPLQYVEVNVEVPATSTPSLWHWRVRAPSPERHKEAIVSTKETFWLRPLPIPELRYPLDRVRVQSDRPIDLSWMSVDTATAYELEVHEPSGNRVHSLNDPTARLQPPAVMGVTRWRVRAKLKSGDSGPWSTLREIHWSEAQPTPSTADPGAAVNSLQAPNPNEPAPPPPIIDEPEIIRGDPVPQHTTLKGLYQWMTFWIAEAQAKDEEASSNLTVKLKWKQVKGATKYHVQVARNRNFKTVIAEADTFEPNWNWHYTPGMENTKGRVFYRVASVGASGNAGAYSAPKSIKIPSAPIGPAEVYAAIDDPDMGEPIDAAEKGNLDTLMHLPSVQVMDIPTAMSQKAPQASDQSTAIAQPTPPKAPTTPPFSQRWTLVLSTGVGRLTQSGSDPSLTSVAPQNAYIQQRIAIETELQRAALNAEKNESAWRALAQIGGASFHASDDGPALPQSDLRSIAWRIEGIKRIERFEKIAPWHLFVGANLDYSYRWVKSGPQSVDTQGALSLGPSAHVIRTFESFEGGFGLSLPFTGLMTKGHLGAELRVWGEKTLAAFAHQRAVCLRANVELGWLRWSSPSGTSTSAWTFWVSPTFQF